METLYPHLTSSIFILFLSVFVLNKLTAKLYFKIAAFVLIFLTAFFLKIDHLTLAAYVYGLSSTLSVTTILLISIYICASLKSTSRGGVAPSADGVLDFKLNFNCLMAFVAITALILYPWSLFNFSSFELYAMGYNAVLIPSLYLLLSLGLVCYTLKYWPLFLLFSLLVLLYIFKAPNGDNFWNYFLDLFLSLFAFGFWIVKGLKKIKNCFLPVNGGLGRVLKN